MPENEKLQKVGTPKIRLSASERNSMSIEVQGI